MLNTSLLADFRSLWIEMSPKGYGLYPIWITLSQGKHFYHCCASFCAYPQWYRVTQPCCNTSCRNQGGQELKIEFLCVALSSGGFFGDAHLDEKYRVGETELREGHREREREVYTDGLPLNNLCGPPSFSLPPGGWGKTFSWWHESWMSVYTCDSAVCMNWYSEYFWKTCSFKSVSVSVTATCMPNGNYKHTHRDTHAHGYFLYGSMLSSPPTSPPFVSPSLLHQSLKLSHCSQ